MKTFIVELKIQAGEYEKYSTNIISANTQEEAETKVLLNECHGVIGENSEHTTEGIVDLNGEFYYSINMCKKVNNEDVETLKKYLSSYH